MLVDICSFLIPNRYYMLPSLRVMSLEVVAMFVLRKLDMMGL